MRKAFSGMLIHVNTHQMLSKLTIKITATLIALCCLFANATAAETPRLFMARKGEYIAFFLPLMHVSSRAERDAYLPTIIEPIFRRVSVMYEEAVPLSHIYPFALHPCGIDVPLYPKVQARLDKRYKITKKYDAYHFSSDIALVENNFAKMMVVFLGPVSYDRHNLPPKFIWHPGQVSRRLAEKYKTKIESIDAMNDFHSAYCQLESTEERSNEISAILEDVESKKQQTDQEASNFYKSILAESIALLDEESSAIKKRSKRLPHTAEKFLLFTRNKIWIEKIVNHSKANTLVFYGLGAGHFLNNKYDEGLFGLLKREGFEVTLIRSLKDVPASILDLPLREPINRRK
jgi:hypothetical protein